MRRKGFTLIELLVVIAIIGILAAMVFPVFARARESARKVVCLSNVKNIALAINMYMNDYGKFPPQNTDPEVLQILEDRRGTADCEWHWNYVNPYLRWVVILDEYVKNRDVWRCPSERNPTTPELIMPGNYKEILADTSNSCYVCLPVYPPGWGGDVTDSFSGRSQWSPLWASGGYTMSILPNEGLVAHGRMVAGNSEASYDDPGRLIVVSEVGNQGMTWGPEHLLFPDFCRMYWGKNIFLKSCSNKDFVTSGGCDTHEVCGIDRSMQTKFWTDTSYSSRFSRHLGGVNIGFADGHASWMSIGQVLARVGDWKNPDPENKLLGLESCWCLPDAPRFDGRTPLPGTEWPSGTFN